MTKPALISLHGIRTRGDWQEGVQSVMDPFFHYIRIKYPEYRNWAILKLSADLLLLLLGLAVVIFVRSRYPSLPLLAWIIASVIFIALFVYLHLGISAFILRVVTRVYEQIVESHPRFSPPSVVAHSLGTLLICLILQRFEGVEFETIVLDGCVARRRYRWSDIQHRFTAVFNEIGGLDPVPWFAGLLRFSIHGMGTAGARGFHGPFVHNKKLNPSSVGPIPSPDRGCCPAHDNFPQVILVHNTRFKRLPHSGFLIGVHHARDFWLPRLLALDPVLHRGFYKSCRAVASSSEKLPGDRRKIFENFKAACFGWTRGSLESCVRSQLQAMLGQSRFLALDAATLHQFVESTLYQLCLDVDEVLAAIDSSPPPSTDKRWQSLDPRFALRKTLASSYQEALARGWIG